MLPYHIIYPQKRQQNDSQFLHYLSLGSHQSHFSHSHLLAFSKITLHPKIHLPKLNYHDLKLIYQNQGSKLHQLMIPLYGNFTVDQKHIHNLFENQPNQNTQQTINHDHFLVKNCNYVQDFQYITNKQEKDQIAVFLFIFYKTTPQTQLKPNQKSKHSIRFQQTIYNKQWLRFPIVQNLPEIEISFLQILENSKITLYPNDILYLEKGKITIVQSGDSKSQEIKNKGNRKGQKNCIDNMIYAAQEIHIEIEKGSLILVFSALSTEETLNF